MGHRRGAEHSPRELLAKLPQTPCSPQGRGDPGSSLGAGLSAPCFLHACGVLGGRVWGPVHRARGQDVDAFTVLGAGAWDTCTVLRSTPLGPRYLAQGQDAGMLAWGRDVGDFASGQGLDVEMFAWCWGPGQGDPCMALGVVWGPSHSARDGVGLQEFCIRGLGDPIIGVSMAGPLHQGEDLGTSATGSGLGDCSSSWSSAAGSGGWRGQVVSLWSLLAGIHSPRPWGPPHRPLLPLGIRGWPPSWSTTIPSQMRRWSYFNSPLSSPDPLP